MASVKAQSIRGNSRAPSMKAPSIKNAPSMNGDAPGTMEHHDYGLSEHTKGLHLDDDASHYTDDRPNGGGVIVPEHIVNEDEGHGEHLGNALASGPDSRPSLSREPSRSYSKPIPIVTTYEPELPDENASVAKRKSVAGSKAGSMRAPSYLEPQAAYDEKPPTVRSPSRAGSVKAPSVKSKKSVRAGSIRPQSPVHSGGETDEDQPTRPRSRMSLHDNGMAAPRSPTFEEPNRARSPSGRASSPRPTSSFGHRPAPNLMTVTEEEGGQRESNYGRDSRSAGQLNRSGTVLSRANTLGRNGTMSRATNGGVVGSRRGAFGRGAGMSVGTQPEEVLGRDDIHVRAELSERILDDATLRRLNTMEKKDATRLARVMKTEAKSEAEAVKGSIKELERLVKLQREAAKNERKSQQRLSKWTGKEHKARLRFLKEKERYERIEGELRNAENDYEERRDHAAGLTGQVAEKTQDLDDLRSQKAADDREREVKLLALKNPAHS